MATTTPPHPPSEDVERIVGAQLETDLTEAGLTPAAARAIRHALEMVVLRLLLVVATKQDLRDSADALRREFAPQFAALHQRIDDHRRETRWQFYVLFTLMLVVLGAVLTSFFV